MVCVLVPYTTLLIVDDNSLFKKMCLVNQGAPGRDDCCQVFQGENTEIVSPDSFAPSVSVPPVKAVFGDRLQVLGDSPGDAPLAHSQSKSVDIDPGQGGDHMLIRYASLLGPFWRSKNMSFRESFIKLLLFYRGIEGSSV